ncbi:MAG: hypothetical protein Q7S33_03200 [Nanoarchaeota archaeon]|nr:hypothetical protein [Nanoarchaeota archaeon]
MFNSQKNVFWQALILAVFVFSIGILLGFSLENWRSSQINALYQQSELDLLDIKIQTEIYSSSNINCDKAIENNVNFANKIYEQAKLLQKYEDSNKLTDNIILQHKKYDLLRTLFWVNSIIIKQKCNATYHNIVYLYDYNNPSLEIKAKQQVISKLLTEIKFDKGDKVMLIPIAGDNDINSVDLLMDKYNIQKQELPIILIDEKIKISDLETKEQLEKYLS